jgi:hypothetical protein
MINLTDGGESWLDDEDGGGRHHPVIILGIAIAAAADPPLSQRVIRIRQTQRLLNNERKLRPFSPQYRTLHEVLYLYFIHIKNKKKLNISHFFRCQILK